MKTFIIASCLCLLIGCGYKSAAYYTRSALGDSVFADVQVNRGDPQSAPVLINALNEAIASRFGKRLASRGEADTIIEIVDGVYDVAALQKDEDGFVIMYRSNVSLRVVVNSAKLKNRSFNVGGTRDFAVEPSSVLSDAAKNEAVRDAALKALDMLIANLMLLGR
jgi:hypothetical protein